jgi:hypothetical protein
VTIDLNLLIIVFLILSLMLNILLVWFSRGLASRLMLVSENMSSLLDHLVEYGSNIKSISEMELYYGDETMQGLIEHTQMVLEILSDFEEIYALTDEDEEGDNDLEEIQEENLDGDKNKSPQEDAPETQVQRKAVFYSGP